MRSEFVSPEESTRIANGREELETAVELIKPPSISHCSRLLRWGSSSANDFSKMWTDPKISRKARRTI
jgi:hypothetical protein